jgi:lipopolysaccharide export system permease protein
VKIVSKYVLKEHIGPFTFASTALTSLMLLQYIARRFGDLVGKGLPWRVIGEFFMLSIPFTVAMTLPMAVLVAVLYAFSRLASENEITALKAGGVSMRQLVVPVLAGGFVLTLVMIGFNDQILPRANHRLAVLQMDIFRTKPTFALREQVINTIKEGQFYLRAGRLDEATSTMRDVVIYDLSDPVRRRTIYADSGNLGLAPNQRDLHMMLYHGVIQTVPTDKAGQLTRLYYESDRLRVPGVASQFQATSDADTVSKGDREMGVCEMQAALTQADRELQSSRADTLEARWQLDSTRHADSVNAKARATPLRPRPARPKVAATVGIGAVYCGFMAKSGAALAFTANAARRTLHRVKGEGVQAAERTQAADSSRKRATDSSGKLAAGAARKPPTASSRPPYLPPSSGVAPSAGGGIGQEPAQRYSVARMNAEQAQLTRNRYDVEIQKKFSLAVACIVFVLVGAPIALRFPRGGVGLVIGVSFFIFALYYVGLIGGEALSDRALLSPVWAMWSTNILMGLIGLVLMSRMGREQNSGRGGDFTEIVETIRMWLARLARRAGIPVERRRRTA